MIITAKYASVCPCCNARIEIGSKVEWSRDSKARHIACAGITAPTAASVTAAPKVKAVRRGFVGSSGRTYSSALDRYRAGDAPARSYGWDGVRGSASYYSSGAYDDE